MFNDLKNETLSNISVVLYDENLSECLRANLMTFRSVQPNFQMFIKNSDSDERTTIYEEFLNPLHDILNNSATNVHVNFIANASEINSTMTICRDFIYPANLTIAQKYHYYRPMDIALDQFLIIIVLCTMSAVGIGSFFYRIIKKKMEDDNDVDDDYKAGKIYL